MRSTSLLLFFVAILCFGCNEQPDSSATTAGRPNIILIVVDDLGWRDVGFMGSTYYETPNLDSLSRQSVIFTNAYAAAANCAPSRACLLSGQNTPRHGIYTVSPSDRGHVKTRRLIPTPNTRFLADSVLTLPEVLKEQGYVTASIGKWHIGEDPTTQGFDINIGGSQAGHPRSYFSPYQNVALENSPEGEYLTERLSAEAAYFIRSQQDTSFFLYLPYYSIHTPLQAKEGRINKYIGKPMSDGQGTNPTYAAMIEHMDEGIGYVMRTLASVGLDENTLVIITSDNGGISYLSRQHPLRAGKGSYYEGGIRIPFLVRWPAAIPEARVSDAPITHMDIFPTLLDVLDIPRLEGKVLDGVSLKDHLLKGTPLPERPLFWHFPIYLEAYRPGQDESRDDLFRTRPGTVMRYGDWKLHEYFEDGAFELYNLADDVGEAHDLSVEQTTKLEELKSIMQEWRETTGAAMPTELNPEFEAGFVPERKR